MNSANTVGQISRSTSTSASAAQYHLILHQFTNPVTHPSRTNRIASLFDNMSDDEIVLNVEPKSQIADSASDERPKYKSWRKKFRKMKLRFDAEMRDNTSLFKDEQKLESLARRLRESNELRYRNQSFAPHC
ncbi:hypothetical protein K461DRAFT_279369 [Myriangium duriaei CBS 260.36]|uniref:INO80 complex subunit 3 N-terminal domain-containing protein n=1 Tax=Myriangium duriaei CBS 260.36 TaxID=1168546 RepID=A0A9P4MG78_9PEZI|nr:hypothetical protein K461DRAFT_279369 [Myriangium duriaei CBS 260.36]